MTIAISAIFTIYSGSCVDSYMVIPRFYNIIFQCIINCVNIPVFWRAYQWNTKLLATSAYKKWTGGAEGSE